MIFTWLLSNWRLALFGLIVLALGIQTARLNNAKAEFAVFKADVDRIASEARVRNAQEALQQAQHAQEAIDGLQARYTALNARYRVLRDKSSGGRVPRLSDAAPSLSACPGNPSQPDAVAGRLDEIEAAIVGVLEGGDKELNKYVEFWGLQQKNSVPNSKP